METKEDSGYNSSIEEIDYIKLIDLSNYPEDKHNNIVSYVNSLSKFEKKALLIAIEHLESSFDILKCIGYQKWSKNII